MASRNDIVLLMIPLALFLLGVVISHASANCGKTHPTTQIYHSYVGAVLEKLAKETASDPTYTYRSWSPDQNPGSAAGIATCFTSNRTECGSCVEEGADYLSSCTSTAGTFSFAGTCLVMFWNIHD